MNEWIYIKVTIKNYSKYIHTRYTYILSLVPKGGNIGDICKQLMHGHMDDMQTQEKCCKKKKINK